jgi:antitoxin MazE
MSVQITRWGNSLGVRIPRQIAGRFGLAEGSRVDIVAEDGRIVITPAAPRYTIEELVADMTPEAMAEAFVWGPDRGREEVPD